MNVNDLTIDGIPLLKSIQQGNMRILARSISLIENEISGFDTLLEVLDNHIPSLVVGITGPPGSGKSTLVDGLIGQWVKKEKKIAVLCVDPSSPFHAGALLGDRIRMSEWYNHPKVFIRSLATRGSLGGLHPRIIEITDLLKIAGFDLIIVETVGVGQIEVEIASLADITAVVLVPESGDEIQTMKAGLMEIADIFVVNKCDRPGADQFAKYLQGIFDFNPDRKEKEPLIVKTIASEKKGLEDLTEKILYVHSNRTTAQKLNLLTQKAYQLIIQKKMKSISKDALSHQISLQIEGPQFNLYKFIASNYPDKL